MPRVFGGAPKCASCEKSVYAAEELKALSKIWHKMCFKCSHCNKKLTPGMETEHDDKPYCKNCYGKHYGPKVQDNRGTASSSTNEGVGGGATAGCLATTTEDNSVSKFKNTHEGTNKVNITNQDKCYTCDKTVYAAEKLVVLNKIFHKPCVKCKACSKTLSPGDVLEHENEIYCKNCHARNFGPKGIGFGISAATLQTGEYAVKE